jgi:hypothetical protein
LQKNNPGYKWDLLFMQNALTADVAAVGELLAASSTSSTASHDGTVMLPAAVEAANEAIVGKFKFVHKLLTSDKVTVDELISYHTMDRLVDFIALAENPPLQLEAAWLLRDCCKKISAYEPLLLARWRTEAVLERLIALLDSKVHALNPTLVLQVLHTLSELSFSQCVDGVACFFNVPGAVQCLCRLMVHVRDNTLQAGKPVASTNYIVKQPDKNDDKIQLSLLLIIEGLCRYKPKDLLLVDPPPGPYDDAADAAAAAAAADADANNGDVDANGDGAGDAVTSSSIDDVHGLVPLLVERLTSQHKLAIDYVTTALHSLCTRGPQQVTFCSAVVAAGIYGHLFRRR